MVFEPPLVAGVLHRRYKRFLVDVRLDSGEEITAHCPNTGAMLGCDRPGSRVWLSHNPGRGRKYPYGWELVETRDGVLVGINTARTNNLVDEALAHSRIAELASYPSRRREVSIDDGRLDFALTGSTDPDCLLEVKNVTAAVDDGVALFPDAVSQRATRHVDALARLSRAGQATALLYCVQRSDVCKVVPAREIDPAYARAVTRALGDGVRFLAYRWQVTPEGIELDRAVDFSLD